MANVSVSIVGNKKLEKHLKNMSNPEKLFDPEFKRAVADGLNRIQRGTPVKTGDLIRNWQVKKLNLSLWIIFNNLVTASKIPIAKIIEEGRKAVFPKNRFLYIGLNEKGKSKKLGAKIPKDFIFGKDYILTKKSRAVRGLFFIKKAAIISAKLLARDIVRKVART